MVLEIRAIIPKKPVAQADVASILKALTDFGISVKATMAKYPQQLPTKRPYKRTGRLGRGWSWRGPTQQGNDILLTVLQKAEYWKQVEGPTKMQLAEFQKRNWPSISIVAEKEWKVAKPKIEKALLGG